MYFNFIFNFYFPLLEQHARNAIEQAITQVEKYTCVRFTPRNGQKDYVEFIFDNG